MSERTRSLIADLYRRLSGEPGMVILTAFPVDEARELTETAYLVLGMLLGQPVAQETDGRLLQRVEQSAESTTKIAQLSALSFLWTPVATSWASCAYGRCQSAGEACWRRPDRYTIPPRAPP